MVTSSRNGRAPRAGRAANKPLGSGPLSRGCASILPPPRREGYKPIEGGGGHPTRRRSATMEGSKGSRIPSPLEAISWGAAKRRGLGGTGLASKRQLGGEAPPRSLARGPFALCRRSRLRSVRSGEAPPLALGRPLLPRSPAAGPHLRAGGVRPSAGVAAARAAIRWRPPLTRDRLGVSSAVGNPCAPSLPLSGPWCVLYVAEVA